MNENVKRHTKDGVVRNDIRYRLISFYTISYEVYLGEIGDVVDGNGKKIGQAIHVDTNSDRVVGYALVEVTYHDTCSRELYPITMFDLGNPIEDVIPDLADVASCGQLPMIYPGQKKWWDSEIDWDTWQNP